MSSIRYVGAISRDGEGRGVKLILVSCEAIYSCVLTGTVDQAIGFPKCAKPERVRDLVINNIEQAVVKTLEGRQIIFVEFENSSGKGA